MFQVEKKEGEMGLIQVLLILILNLILILVWIQNQAKHLMKIHRFSMTKSKN